MPKFDSRISLALSMHAQPGVFALLIGSGTSTGAGVPTGWGVIKDLVKKAAAAHGSALGGEPSDGDIEAWWAENGDGKELGYSGLLESLGPNQAARSALIRGYFEPTTAEREEGKKVPGAAHNSIAKLVRDGYVRVILTTNFDPLLEQALDAAAVPYQVLSTDIEIEGRTPLVHSRCTVVKIHGDYRSLLQRNTVDELAEYSPAVGALLEEVFENYGLVVNGWSADWDRALVTALKSRRIRRYPLFWSTLTPLGTSAKPVAEQQGATVISGYTADEFFPDLVARIEALERLMSPPMSAEIAVARLKKLLPYRESYIEIRDLLGAEIDKVSGAIASREQMFPKTSEGPDLTAADAECARLRDTSSILVRLAAQGVMLDRDRIHAELWPWAVQRLLKARRPVSGEHNMPWVNLAHYPAMLLVRAIAMIAVAHSREDVLVHTLTEPTWKDQFGPSSRPAVPAFRALQDYIVIHPLIPRGFPRWNGGNKHRYPVAQLLEDDMRNLIGDLFDSDEEFDQAFRRAEYRMALADTVLSGGTKNPSPGLYTGEVQWFNNEHRWERDFRENGDRAAWGWQEVDAGADDPFEESLVGLRAALSQRAMGIP